jgi:hypothetical protein
MDDKEARWHVSEMIKDTGFAPVHLGSLSAGGRLQQAKGALSFVNFIKLYFSPLVLSEEKVRLLH